MTSHREFELLVTRIEGALAPTGAVIKSPDYVRDNVTGEQREVDASIRYRVGSVELLVTVECRDRSRTEDVIGTNGERFVVTQYQRVPRVDSES
jgi:hypothetical protein